MKSIRSLNNLSVFMKIHALLLLTFWQHFECTNTSISRDLYQFRKHCHFSKRHLKHLAISWRRSKENILMNIFKGVKVFISLWYMQAQWMVCFYLLNTYFLLIILYNICRCVQSLFYNIPSKNDSIDCIELYKLQGISFRYKLFLNRSRNFWKC